MSIYRSKVSKVVIQCEKSKEPHSFVGNIYAPLEVFKYYEIPKFDAEQLFTESETQQMIESAVAEHEQAMQDNLQYYSDLREQIEELKAKIPQPVEISRELGYIINKMKIFYGYDWEYKFIEENDCTLLPEKLRKYYRQLNVIDRINIIKNGCVIKPELTLRQKLAKALDLSDELIPYSEELDIIMNVLKQEGVIKDAD